MASKYTPPVAQGIASDISSCRAKSVHFSPYTKNGTPSSNSHGITNSVDLPSGCNNTKMDFVATSKSSTNDPRASSTQPGALHSVNSVNDSSCDGCASIKSAGLASGYSPKSANDNHSLSPASLSNGNKSVSFSTGDGAFSCSFTDESQDELDSREAREQDWKIKVQDNRTVDETEEKTLPSSCIDSVIFDRTAVIKTVIDKVYVHTITYTIEDLIRFKKSEELSHSEPCQSDMLNRKTPADQKELGHGKFSIRHFLKSMSPGSQHRKTLKHSGSLGSHSSSTLADSLDSLCISEEPEPDDSEEVLHKTNTIKKFSGAGTTSPVLGCTSSNRKHKRTSHDAPRSKVKSDVACSGKS